MFSGSNQKEQLEKRLACTRQTGKCSSFRPTTRCRRQRHSPREASIRDRPTQYTVCPALAKRRQRSQRPGAARRSGIALAAAVGTSDVIGTSRHAHTSGDAMSPPAHTTTVFKRCTFPGALKGVGATATSRDPSPMHPRRPVAAASSTSKTARRRNPRPPCDARQSLRPCSLAC